MGKAFFRVGFGYDVHELVAGRPLILGGVAIPFAKGLMGYSDADVLTHAVMDAILGALGKGDIGQHFPDSDPAYQGADSLLLLQSVITLAHKEGFDINNLDATIVAQRPRLSHYLHDMEEMLSRVLKAEPAVVNVKATTTEGLGFSGREEGIAAYAIVSLCGK